MQFKYIFCHLLIASWFIRGGRSQGNGHSNTPYTANAGNYAIYACGTRIDEVRALLEQTKAFLQEAVGSTQSTAVLGNNPYKAFFRDVDPNVVKRVLTNIIAGDKLSIQGNLYHPTIVCVNDVTPGLKQQWDRCQMGRVRAMWSDRSQFVYLCPDFWELKLQPESSDCGAVVAGGTQLQGSSIEYTQYTLLIHELVHVYIGAPVPQPEVYGVNIAMRLGRTVSVVNPSNYAFYAGSQSLCSCPFFCSTELPMANITILQVF